MYTNAAPQWEAFNGLNWANLEDSIRNYVTGKKLVLVLITVNIVERLTHFVLQFNLSDF